MGHYRPEGSYNAIILNSPLPGARAHLPPVGQKRRPAAAWHVSIGESSTPQTPWDPSGVGTGRTKPIAHTEAHSVTGRSAFLRPVSSGVRGDHLLGHQEQQKDGLSRDRGIKRNEMSIYAAKALYRPDPSEATFAVTDDLSNRKIPLAQSAENIIFGLEKFFEKTGLGVPRNRRNSEKVAEGSTITGLGFMTRR
jgi:hypothetical protein